MVIREQLRAERNSLGEENYWRFPASASSLANLALRRKLWQDYHRRAENRIAELKHDVGADDFCLQEFFATEAAFRSILLLFNLLGEFRRASGFST